MTTENEIYATIIRESENMSLIDLTETLAGAIKRWCQKNGRTVGDVTGELITTLIESN